MRIYQCTYTIRQTLNRSYLLHFIIGKWSNKGHSPGCDAIRAAILSSSACGEHHVECWKTNSRGEELLCMAEQVKPMVDQNESGVRLILSKRSKIIHCALAYFTYCPLCGS